VRKREKLRGEKEGRGRRVRTSKKKRGLMRERRTGKEGEKRGGGKEKD
jgi:hypothetical protein